MTEMEFLKVFNDIEDKFVDEEIEGETEPLTPVTVNPNGAKNRFFWVKFAGIAAACAAVVGGLTYLKNNPNIAVDPSVTEGESSVQNNAPELGAKSTLYQTKLNCNENSYDVRIYLCRDYTADAPSNEKYIWGDAAMELSLDGKVLDTMEIYENCYEECEWGMPFDKEKLASDYFKVLSMEQDVLAYLTPNSMLGEEDKSGGAVLNARFFTVSKEGEIMPIERYATEEEKKDIYADTDELQTHIYSFFKITPNFDTEENQLTYHLEKQVLNPWWQNGTIYEKGDFKVSFDFENYTLTCEDDNYKYLVYCADGVSRSKDKNVTLLDGSLAKEDEITELSITVPYNPYIGDYYETNVSFMVPFFAPWEDRTPGKEGKWTKVKEGDKIGDFDVGEVNSHYSYYQTSFFPAGYSTSVELKGELSCSGIAERSTYTNGASDGGVIITLDKEDCEKLPGFSINRGLNYYGVQDYDVEDIRAKIIIYDALEGYEELYHALYVQNRKSVRVELTLNDFFMTYSFETGNQYDNFAMVRLKNINHYTLEIAKEDQVPRESDSVNEEIYDLVNHAKTYDELKKGLSKYSDSFYKFVVYRVPDSYSVEDTGYIQGELKEGMVCVIFYDEKGENRWEIPITEKIGGEIILMDGSAAAENEILSEDDKTFTVNSCFAVPFSAANINRRAWKKGDWIKLKEGDTFGDYTVESAESTYTKPSEGVFPPYKSKVVLSGKLSCTGTAKIIPSPTGYDGLVELTLDEDCCQKLMNLAPYLDNGLLDSPSQERIYMWLTYKGKDYQPIIDKLQNTESVRVKLDTEHFSLSYQYGSEYWYDGKVMLNSVGNEHSLEIISE